MKRENNESSGKHEKKTITKSPRSGEATVENSTGFVFLENISKATFKKSEVADARLVRN